MIDYEVSFAITTPGPVYFVYQTGVVDSQIVITGLNAGTSYSFKIRSRNIIGYASFSDEIQILAA